MKFIVGNKPNKVHASRWVPFNTVNRIKSCQANVYNVIKLTENGKPELMAEFPDLNNEYAEAMAHDYCDFLNDKYCDKEINKEWPQINREERIKYHLEQLQLLRSDKRLYWNEHGNGVKRK